MRSEGAHQGWPPSKQCCRSLRRTNGFSRKDQNGMESL